MLQHYWNTFAELILTPFEDISLVWGIVPLYFALLLGELTSSKANFRTAIQTGFSFLWAAAQWLYAYWKAHGPGVRHEWSWNLPINLFVTFLVLALGAVALFSGLRRHYPKYGSFLGHTRFANYFMITIFPIQSHKLPWSWDRLCAIILFAVPIWLLLHFGLMPFRGKKG
jgi:hypothetical protein